MRESLDSSSFQRFFAAVSGDRDIIRPMEYKFSRRELALGAIAGAVVSQAQESQAVKPSDAGVVDADLDPVRWTKQRYQDAPLKMTFKAGTRRDAEVWQK